MEEVKLGPQLENIPWWDKIFLRRKGKRTFGRAKTIVNIMK